MKSKKMLLFLMLLVLVLVSSLSFSLSARDEEPVTQDKEQIHYNVWYPQEAVNDPAIFAGGCPMCKTGSVFNGAMRLDTNVSEEFIGTRVCLHGNPIATDSAYLVFTDKVYRCDNCNLYGWTDTSTRNRWDCNDR